MRRIAAAINDAQSSLFRANSNTTAPPKSPSLPSLSSFNDEPVNEGATVKRSATDPSKLRAVAARGVGLGLEQVAEDDVTDDMTTLPFSANRLASKQPSNPLQADKLLIELLASQAALSIDSKSSDILDADAFDQLLQVRLSLGAA